MLTEELESYRSTVRRRAEARLALVGRLDRDQRFSAEVWTELHDMGVVGLPFPSSVGGGDGSFLAFVVATEELARVSASAALYPGTTVQVATALLAHGTPTRWHAGSHDWLPARRRSPSSSPAPHRGSARSSSRRPTRVGRSASPSSSSPSAGASRQPSSSTT